MTITISIIEWYQYLILRIVVRNSRVFKHLRAQRQIADIYLHRCHTPSGKWRLFNFLQRITETQSEWFGARRFVSLQNTPTTHCRVNVFLSFFSILYFAVDSFCLIQSRFIIDWLTTGRQEQKKKSDKVKNKKRVIKKKWIYSIVDVRRDKKIDRL